MKILLVILFLSVAAFAGVWFFTKQDDWSPIQEENSTSSQDGETLDLSGQQLARIPDSVFSQTDLEHLDVSDNQLTGAIQGEIRFLQNLRSLDASDNLMTGVPAEIGQLSKLETLDLSNNQLTGLPYELGNLQNLKTLNLSGNQYSQADLQIIKDKLPADVLIITE